ncbi:hypothetical protein K493DRAFT_339089 [Basidiobolus meristosporus CBS 931.73]|uniref:DUF1690-domain-containing protein n=1 Tax=Basidiobolus meristosporus CBS 931.73 TaxID=1314790 RepID=A0A1Y1Y1J1_9FUNG|nr:hypothetical protein K493DRAFT_339089 [Basidiobolus meristosporus CBS 931.73]|eukprot:ORX91882.1 hypothetical protein K493DRAFT_339089 [Basidiobolus meristosporus CBS 931.73]
MGAQQSRQEPLVFYGESDVALKFSHDFVNQLQRNNHSNSSNDHKSDSLSPAEIDQIVEKRVSQELKKIRSSLAVEQEKKRPSTKVIEQDLERLADKNKIRSEKPLAPEIEERQQNLISCYKNNQDKPLDCWKEVEMFKESVEKARKEFVATHL